MLPNFVLTLQKKCHAFYRKFRLKYAVPLLLLCLYTVIGALIFYFSERQHDVDKRQAYLEAQDDAFYQIKERLVEIKWDPALNTSSLVQERTLEAIAWFIRALNLTDVIKDRAKPTPWSFWGSLFYAGTLYTTIGYGHYATVTATGRVCTCIYTLVGIPIFLVIVKEMGQMLSRLARRTHKRGSHAWRHFKTRFCEWTRGSRTDLSMISGVQEEQTKRRQIPISLALIVLILWIFMSAAFFCIWEDWGYMTSMYFFFVSISTVGLGDVVPTHPDMMLANFTLILVGLALLSMCFNLIQLWIEQLLEDMLQQFIADFEKITTVIGDDDKHPMEIGISGTLASAPLSTPFELRRRATGAKNWLSSHLASTLMKRKASRDDDESDSDSDDEADDGDVERRSPSAAPAYEHHVAMQILQNQTDGGGLRSQPFSRFLDTNKLQSLEEKIMNKITKKSVSVQTENEFTEIIEFLSIPKAGAAPRNADSASLDVETENTYYTAKETTPDVSDVLDRPAELDWLKPNLFDDDQTLCSSLLRQMEESASPDSGAVTSMSPTSEYRKAIPQGKVILASSDYEPSSKPLPKQRSLPESGTKSLTDQFSDAQDEPEIFPEEWRMSIDDAGPDSPPPLSPVSLPVHKTAPDFAATDSESASNSELMIRVEPPPLSVPEEITETDSIISIDEFEPEILPKDTLEIPAVHRRTEPADENFESLESRVNFIDEMSSREHSREPQRETERLIIRQPEGQERDSSFENLMQAHEL